MSEEKKKIINKDFKAISENVKEKDGYFVVIIHTEEEKGGRYEIDYSNLSMQGLYEIQKIINIEVYTKLTLSVVDRKDKEAFENMQRMQNMQKEIAKIKTKQ